MEQIKKKVVPAETKFKTNMLRFFDDLIIIFEEKDETRIVDYCKLIKQISEDADADFLISKFIEQIDVKREDGTTLREEYSKGNLFSLFFNFVNSLPYSGGVLKETSLDKLDDEEKDTFISYIKSFFNIAEKYVKEKNGAGD